MKTRRYDILGVGIAAVDDLLYVEDYPPVDCKIPVHGSTRQGGGPACTATAAAGSLGGRAAYVARFGQNELSRYIKTALQRCGVDTSHIVEDPAGGPYHSVIVVDSAGHRNVFYNPALYNTVGANDLATDLIQSAALVLLDHITEPALIGVAKKIRSLKVPLLCDLEGHTDSAPALAALADYLVVPRAFGEWLSGESHADVACAWLARQPRTATIVTDGAGGSYLCTGRDLSVKHFPAFEVDAFDTNGCGDTFHGAFGLAVARNLPLHQAILFASAAAALKALAYGGRRRGWEALPALDDVAEFLRARMSGPQKMGLLEAIDRLRVPEIPAGISSSSG